MPDFDIGNVQDEDQVEITDLDPQDDGFSGSLSIVLLKLARKTPFVNTRDRSTMLAWLACLIMLLFLVQPDLTSIQASRTQVPAQFSSLLVRSPMFIVAGSSVKQVTWIKISNEVEIVRQAPVGIIVWHYCKMLHWHIPRKNPRPIVIICT